MAAVARTRRYPTIGRHDDITCICIMRKHIASSIDLAHLLSGEIWQKSAHVFFEGRRVVAGQEGRVREPTFLEGPGALYGFGVCGSIGARDLVSAVGFEGYA